MPLYDYVCRDCGLMIEVQQSYKDDPLSVCPRCQGELRRAITRVGLVFKGGGYYINDSRPAGKKDEPKTEAAEKPAAADKVESPTVESAAPTTPDAAAKGAPEAAPAKPEAAKPEKAPEKPKAAKP